MGVQFREWREDDDLTLLQLWGDPETGEAGHFRAVLRPSSNEPWSRCIVAEDDGVPVAAGVVYETSLHPDRLWVYIEVARENRRAGLGSTLLGMLRKEAENAPSGVAKLRAKVEPDTPGAAFAAAAGLEPIQRSRVVVVEPGKLKLPVFEDHGPQLDEAATGSVELTRVVADFYNAVHDWDRADMSVGRAQQMLLNDATGASGAVVLRDKPKNEGGKIAAFAVSYTSERTDTPADVLLGWDTSLAETEAEAAVASLLAMVAYQYPVQLEVDESMTALVRVLEPLLASGAARQDGPETLIVSS
ncbi:GNAT family N-acetyltransferase [Arthrobacter caoxuetaonis]|uniref:GNAT family N-acetyltransferase n=1 Tax=Arthrobacter caoxuetaonis TaxID=2886935 RepID=A0A9X1ME58_9MICC|nr:GNAT family N-acetyltransferase [Arthrobacter caoxuetaonis]MCC3297124.1 GNAT family N-acetyltransferase [Arthrobacter caoxuetaonis]USQ58314.1 GNAT family N-acetyltransferase [Arthrobacter caoxuetaonis]